MKNQTHPTALPVVNMHCINVHAYQLRSQRRYECVVFGYTSTYALSAFRQTITISIHVRYEVYLKQDYMIKSLAFFSLMAYVFA